MHFNKRYECDVDHVTRPDGKVEIWAMKTLRELRLIKGRLSPLIEKLLPKKWVIINSYYPSNPKYHTKKKSKRF